MKRTPFLSTTAFLMVFYLVAQVLREAGLLLGVGLEMFRSDSRAGLDRWVVGALAEKDGVQP